MKFSSPIITTYILVVLALAHTNIALRKNKQNNKLKNLFNKESRDKYSKSNAQLIYT